MVLSGRRITGSINTTRYYNAASVLINGKVLLTGGYTGSSVINSAELYDPSPESWPMTRSMISVQYCDTASV
ncbi:unnamed protein product [Rotaria sp. Silwood2]|nr:unnamed protein product [Rotaria sp. Silwood2]